MLGAALDFIGRPANRTKMAVWESKVEQIISSPPGDDEGLPQNSIESLATRKFSKLTTWEIVCEEVVDTQYPRIYFEHAREELGRRGISDSEYVEMRRFVWLTAGWLNFEMMLWDWCSLDERDIHSAIDWQYKDGWISADERDRRREYARRYAACP